MKETHMHVHLSKRRRFFKDDNNDTENNILDA